MPGDIVRLALSWLELSRAENELRLRLLRMRRESDHGMYAALEIAWRRAREDTRRAEDKMRLVAGELGEVRAPD